MGAAAVITAALVLFLIAYVLVKGLPNVSWTLLSTAPSYLSDRIGILPDLLNTLYIVIATLLIVLPLGVGAAASSASSNTRPRHSPASRRSSTASWACYFSASF